MSEAPFFAVKLGPWDCFCTIQDEEDRLLFKAPGLGERNRSHVAAVDQPQRAHFDREDVPTCGSRARELPSANAPLSAAAAAISETQAARSRKSHATWRPLLPRSESADMDAHEVEDAVGIHDWHDLPFAPVPRQRVGSARRRARDAWNFEELRLGEALVKGDVTCAEGLDELDFRAVLATCWGDALEEEDLRWTLLLSQRGTESRPVSLQELHYAIRSWHGLRSLPKEAMRRVALVDLGPPAEHPGSDVVPRVAALLQELNGGSKIIMREAQMVLDEAAGIGGGHAGRAELLRAVGAWYTNVQRRDTTWNALLGLYCGHVAWASEYHLEVLYHLARFAPDREVLEGGVPPRHNSLERTATAEAASLALDRVATPLEHVLRVICAVGYAAMLLGALVLPTAFFSYFVFVGAEHGRDTCPLDLDGLLTWFGVLGLSALAVDCAEGAVQLASEVALDGPQEEGPMHAVSIASSCWGWVSLLLRAVLLVFPWLGTAWSFRLTHNEQDQCGAFLWTTSACIWPSLLLVEIVGVFRFSFGLAVMAEHEISLRQVLQAPEPAVRSPALSSKRRAVGSSPTTHASSPVFGIAEDSLVPSGRIGDEDVGGLLAPVVE